MFSAKAKVCGIIGNPIEHSLSPVLHRSISKELNVDMAYVPLKVENNLEYAIKGAHALGFYGLNVTIPYKQEVMQHLIEIDDTAKAIGAVNTLVRCENGFKGYNTDLPGLKKSLDDKNIELKDKNIIMLGAGGAAKAVLYMCLANGVKSISIFNRNLNKADKLIEEVFEDLSAMNRKITAKIKSFSLEDLRTDSGIKSALNESNYIAFQTSSVGMYPNISDCIVENDMFYDKCDAGVDLIYTPLETVFLKNFLSRNKIAVSGLDMLINQGVLAWELWNNKEIPEEVSLKAKETVLKELIKN